MIRLLLPTTLVFLLAGPSAHAADTPGDEYFEKHVRPLLVAQCLKCHGDKKPQGGLTLTSRAALLTGGESGPAVVPGKPDKSLLVQAVRYIDDPRMPPRRKLSDADITTLTRWVQIGAPWPGDSTKPTPASRPFLITAEQRQFWSFQPVKSVAVPALQNANWTRNPIDRFVLARLDQAKLRPTPQADARTLIRRATFDLIGLPPTPAEVENFVADTRPDAYERLIDRLLASPAYGQRWGRHWLDLVRYTDSFDSRITGNSEMDCADAWRYRDWVIDNLNADRRYDRFIMDQIAGDCLPRSDATRRDGIIATGMLAFGNWGGGDADKEKLLTDIADDQVDVVTRTFLGLTVACARCHDHKFDPISTADYYGIAGMFFSSHILPNVGPKTNGPPMLRIPLASPAQLAQRQARLDQIAKLDKQLQADRRKAYEEYTRSQLSLAPAYLLATYDLLYPAAGKARPEIATIALREKLDADLLRRWLDLIGHDQSRPLDRLVQNAHSRPGVHSWQGAADCPNVTINTNRREETILTFKLPPRSLAVHPGPASGVVLSWTSPLRGKVEIVGSLRDADPTCGDGVLWRLEHRRLHPTLLASGAIANGGTGRLDQPKPLSLEVEIGDRIDLVILPGKGYECDMTLVDLTIRQSDGKQTWSPATDLLADPTRKTKQTWALLDTTTLAARISDPALAAWSETMASVHAGKRKQSDLRDSAQAVAKSAQLTNERSPFWIRNKAEEARLPAPVRLQLIKREAELVQFRKAPLPPQDFAVGAQEGGVPGSPHAGIHDVRIHNRGRYDRLGDVVPRRFPEILAGTKQERIRAGSGRAELARWIADAKNPLTARVMMNRLWQQHFGRGLVNTPSNFGKLGERPTHPELLDWLATEFVESGWSLKQMHRLMMTSATYRQDSIASSESMHADPDNLLLGRMQRRRLEAEAIRDSLLAVSGRLDVRPGGLATRDFNQPRRTLYLMTIRSDRTGFGPLFDVADNSAPVEKRTVSTVAPQALFLLNNAFVQARAGELADRLLAHPGTDAERIDHAYRLLFGRSPRDPERRLALGYLTQTSTPRDKWREYAQVLLCANEFLYVD